MFMKLKRSKIGTALTITGSEKDANSVVQWSATIPKVFSLGSHTPIAFPGLKHTVTPSNVPLKRLLTSYMMTIPGHETIILSAPNVEIGGDQAGLLAYVNSMNYDLAWASFCPIPNGFLFVMSSPVVPHILNDLSDKVTMETSQWTENLHKWLKTALVHRYFDGSQYRIGRGVVLNAYDLTPDPVPVAQEPVLTQKEAPVSVQTPTPATEPVKIKRKGGRPKKVAA